MSVFHLYVIRIPNRERVMRELGERGIGCGIHYPIPVHKQEAYEGLGIKAGALPVTERYADEILSLPMFPELTSAQVQCVATAVKDILAGAVPAESVSALNGRP
jgi:dTDP-4-amino-4,6-dideoxygalactose transaminase